jgi:hypothetical protein
MEHGFRRVMAGAATGVARKPSAVRVLRVLRVLRVPARSSGFLVADAMASGVRKGTARDVR